MSLHVEQARCSLCGCPVALVNLSRHELCIFCEPRAEERHAIRVQTAKSVVATVYNKLFKQRKA